MNKGAQLTNILDKHVLNDHKYQQSYFSFSLVEQEGN